MRRGIGVKLVYVFALVICAAGAAFALSTPSVSKTGTDSDSTPGSWNAQAVLDYSIENDMSGHYYYWPDWSLNLNFIAASNYLDAEVRYRVVAWEDGPGNDDTQIWETGPQGDIMATTTLDPDADEEGISFLPSPDRWGVNSNTVFLKLQTGPTPTDLGVSQVGL